MIERYGRGNRYFKVWLIRVTAESKCLSSIPFLISLLTDIDPMLSQEAYNSLSKICDMDPAKAPDTRINSPSVIMKFNEFYLRSRTKP